MSQTFTTNTYDGANVAQTDLQNMENNFAALKSSFSGETTPGNTVAGMFWMDTTQNLLKVRNYNDTAWLGIMQASTTHKILVYRNDAETGWAIDSTETDTVIALKGGSTYTTGGATAGSWTLPDHTLVTTELPAHTHGASGSHTHPVMAYLSGGSGNGVMRVTTRTSGLSHSGAATAGGSHTHTSVGSDGAHNHGATYRPAAVVCTMQYVNV